jgi:hypothetical protein
MEPGRVGSWVVRGWVERVVRRLSIQFLCGSIPNSSNVRPLPNPNPTREAGLTGDICWTVLALPSPSRPAWNSSFFLPPFPVRPRCSGVLLLWSLADGMYYPSTQAAMRSRAGKVQGQRGRGARSRFSTLFLIFCLS